MLDELTPSSTMVNKGQTLWQLWKKTVVSKPYLEPVNIALVGKYIALPDSKPPSPLNPLVGRFKEHQFRVLSGYRLLDLFNIREELYPNNGE